MANKHISRRSPTMLPDESWKTYIALDALFALHEPSTLDEMTAAISKSENKLVCPALEWCTLPKHRLIALVHDIVDSVHPVMREPTPYADAFLAAIIKKRDDLSPTLFLHLATRAYQHKRYAVAKELYKKHIISIKSVIMIEKALDNDDIDMFYFARELLPKIEIARNDVLMLALQTKHLVIIDEFPKHYVADKKILSSLAAHKMALYEWTESDVGKLLSFFGVDSVHLRTELMLALNARCSDYAAYLIRKLEVPLDIPAFIASCMRAEWSTLSYLVARHSYYRLDLVLFACKNDMPRLLRTLFDISPPTHELTHTLIERSVRSNAVKCVKLLLAMYPIVDIAHYIDISRDETMLLLLRWPGVGACATRALRRALLCCSTSCILEILTLPNIDVSSITDEEYEVIYQRHQFIVISQLASYGQAPP
jgi:hypothetical protein